MKTHFHSYVILTGVHQRQIFGYVSTIHFLKMHGLQNTKYVERPLLRYLYPV